MRGMLVSQKLLILAGSVLAASALAACSSSSPSSSSAGSTNAGNASTATTASSPATQAAATSAPPTTQAAAATAPDPCAMVTSAEATTLTGSSMGAGKKATDASLCTYSSPTGHLSVQTARGTSVAEAQAAWTARQAQLPQLLQEVGSVPGMALHVTPVSGFGDRAALISEKASLQGVTLSVTGMYLLKGTTFTGFEVIELNHPAPSAAAVEAEAKTVLGRM